MQPEENDALLDQANRLLEAGKPEESLRCLDAVEVTALDSQERIEWGSLRAWALTELDHHEEALETLEPLIEEFPHSSRLLGTLGVVLSNTDELDEARNALEEAVEVDGEDEVAVANLALVYERLREYERALTCYERSLDLGADVDWVLQRMSSTLSEMGRYAAAKAVLKRYLSLVPDDATQWIALAILHSDDEDYEQASYCYAQAELIDPADPSLRLNWGVSAVRAGDLRAARVQLRYLQDLEPRSVRHWLLRAFILEEEGQTTAARVIYERVAGRKRFADEAELAYALEMAMDFFSRHGMRPRCERLLEQAYHANVCTVELCEAYRAATGERAKKAYWYSVMIEADYRPGLADVRPGRRARAYSRFIRAYQVVARNHDEAVSMVLGFARRMGESNARVREFVGTEPIDDSNLGIYEVESTVFPFDDDQPA